MSTQIIPLTDEDNFDVWWAFLTVLRQLGYTQQECYNAWHDTGWRFSQLHKMVIT